MTGRPVPPGGDALTRPVPPWWSVRSGPGRAERIAARGRAAGLEVRVLAGDRMRTSAGLFAEHARGWRFPEYFGHNWSALEDCLTDLAWLPAEGYLCVVTDAERLLHDEPDDVLGLYLDLAARVGEAWAVAVADGEPWDRPGRPFHTVLGTADPESAAALLRRAEAGGADLSRREQPGAPRSSRE